MAPETSVTTPKRVHFLDGETTVSSRPVKKRRNVRGASKLQLPTVVMAMGFAVGTTSDDIRQSLKMTTDEAGGFDTAKTIEATSCDIVSVGPRVIAKLVFSTKADAEKVVDEWNSIEVDGSDLVLWITDDDAVVTVKSDVMVKVKDDPVVSPFALMAAAKNSQASRNSTPGPTSNGAFGSTVANGTSATVFSAPGKFGANPQTGQHLNGSFV